MKTRREALKLILATAAFPVAGIALAASSPRTEPLIPFQLNTSGEGWTRDAQGRQHPVADLTWPNRVEKILLDGKEKDLVVEFNTEEGWVRCWDLKAPNNEYLMRGKVTIIWKP
jgi:hypothetical protein